MICQELVKLSATDNHHVQYHVMLLCWFPCSQANLLQELEDEKEGLKSRSDARREAALSRRAARAERIAAARAAGDASLAAVAAQYSKEDEEADRAAQGETG